MVKNERCRTRACDIIWTISLTHVPGAWRWCLKSWRHTASHSSPTGGGTSSASSSGSLTTWSCRSNLMRSVLRQTHAVEFRDEMLFLSLAYYVWWWAFWFLVCILYFCSCDLCVLYLSSRKILCICYFPRWEILCTLSLPGGKLCLYFCVCFISPAGKVCLVENFVYMFVYILFPQQGKFVYALFSPGRNLCILHFQLVNWVDTLFSLVGYFVSFCRFDSFPCQDFFCVLYFPWWEILCILYFPWWEILCILYFPSRDILCILCLPHWKKIVCNLFLLLIHFCIDANVPAWKFSHEKVSGFLWGAPEVTELKYSISQR